MMQDQKHWCQTLITRISTRSQIPRYQLLLFINFALKWVLAGMILFSLNFFYLTPEFTCTDSQIPPGQSCQQHVCTLAEDQWLGHLEKPVPKSIALDYGVVMLCGRRWLASLLQAMSYIGSFVGYFVMSHAADNFGRKRAERIAWLINILGLIILIASWNLAMVGIGSFLMGLGANAAITLHYTLIKQLLVGKMRERSFLILQVAFSIGVAMVALGSWFVSDWKIVAGVFMLTPAVLVVPYSVWIVEETPGFSLRRGRGALLRSMNRIAAMNNEDPLAMQDLQFIPQPSVPTQSPQQTQYTLLDLFRYRSLRKITLTCAAINLVIEFVYDGTILSLDKIGINVYLDQILVGFVEIFAALFCSWIVVKVRRNEFLRVCFVLAAVFTGFIGVLALFFEHKDNQLNFHVVMQMFLLALLRFVLNSMWGLFFVYVAELFPTNVLSLAFGWVSAIGTVGAFISPFIRLLTANATMFIMGGLCLGVFFLIQGLRETKGEKAQQEIEEREAERQNKQSIQSEKQNT